MKLGIPISSCQCLVESTLESGSFQISEGQERGPTCSRPDVLVVSSLSNTTLQAWRMLEDEVIQERVADLGNPEGKTRGP